MILVLDVDHLQQSLTNNVVTCVIRWGLWSMAGHGLLCKWRVVSGASESCYLCQGQAATITGVTGGTGRAVELLLTQPTGFTSSAPVLHCPDQHSSVTVQHWHRTLYTAAETLTADICSTDQCTPVLLLIIDQWCDQWPVISFSSGHTWDTSDHQWRLVSTADHQHRSQPLITRGKKS